VSATATRSRALRFAAPIGALAVVIVLGVMFFPKARVGLANCAGHTGPASFGVPYALSLRADGGTVVSTVDFDRRLWRAVDGRVARNGLVPASATVLDGAVTLLNAQEATFSSDAAYATLLPVTPADGCASSVVVRSGRPLPHR